MNTSSKLAGVFKRESWCKKRCLVKEPNKVLNSLVTLVDLSFGTEFWNDCVVWIDFHCLLRHHVAGHAVVAESLSFHDTFHVSSPTVFRCNKYTGWFIDTSTYYNFLNFVTKNILNQFAKRFKFSFNLFLFLFLIFSVVKIKTFFCAWDKLFAVVLFKLLDHIFIDWVN